MNESLFNRLFHYKETSNIKPEENYLTELLAWMIDTLPKFGHDYVRFLCSKCQPAISLDSFLQYEVNAQTQVSVKKGFIDMVITADTIGFICEHKIDSELSEGQLRKYKQCKNEIDKSLDYKIVLVTKKQIQHKQNPDIAITWQDIYDYYAKKIEDNDYDISEEIIIEQFLMYLTEAGMGKQESINIESVNRYSEAEKLENTLKRLFDDLKNDPDWECTGIQKLVPA